MQNKYDPESVDHSLRDVRNCDQSFGGITVVFGGDFQQILPVMPRGSWESIVRVCLKRSSLWRHIQELKLKTNMCLEQNPEKHAYAEWLLQIGKGALVTPDGKVTFPQSMKCHPNTVHGLLDAVYPNLQVPGSSNNQYLLD
jgi:hypothetical protein